jgi:hypothetical protein
MRTRIVILGVALAIALLLRLLAHLSWFLSLLISFVGWPLGGTLITLDDELPGGWANPDGKQRPSFFQTRFWGRILGGLAIALAGGAIDDGWTSSPAIRWWLASAAAALGAIFLLRGPWRRLRKA